MQKRRYIWKNRYIWYQRWHLVIVFADYFSKKEVVQCIEYASFKSLLYSPLSFTPLLCGGEG